MAISAEQLIDRAVATLTPDGKVALAKRLMISAEIQRRAIHQAASAEELCGCSHRRDQHTAATSINYSGGFCMVDGCKCHHFMMSETPKENQ